MSEKTLGFGIVGCGLISDFHGNAITAAEGGQVIAATDLDADRLGQFVHGETRDLAECGARGIEAPGMSSQIAGIVKHHFA